MRRYLAAAALLLACGVLAVLLTSRLRAEAPGRESADDARTQPERQHAPPADRARMLNELIELRDEIGGGVLRGSLLEPSPAESRMEFAHGLEQAMQLPPTQATTPGLVVAAPAEAVKPVGVIRKNCRQLDRLAAEIEDLGRYETADQLREVAHELRLIARQLARQTAAE
jgi:hypothetical protein